MTTGNDKLKASLRRLRRVALGPTVADARRELEAVVQEQMAGPSAPVIDKDVPALQQILARLDALENAVAEMRQSDARLSRAAVTVATAVALLLVELLSK